MKINVRLFLKCCMLIELFILLDTKLKLKEKILLEKYDRHSRTLSLHVS